MRRFLLALSLLALVLVLVLAGTGCGGDSGSSSTEPTTTAETTVPTETATGGGAGETGDPTNGAKVFASAGCGGCHTFEAAGSSGSVGPNLDDLAPDFDTVVTQVTNGGGGMPSFADQLSEQEIRDVAAFVSGTSS